MNEKQMAGEKAAEYVKDGMTVGLGTGSTVFYTIEKLGQLVGEGLSIKGIPTSVETEKLAKKWGIPLTDFGEVDHLDIAIDGADEANPDMVLIKGGGGALLREKIIAKAANTFIVVADSAKMVEKLGKFPLPVEIVPFGYKMTVRHLEKLPGCTMKMRMHDDVLFVTDNGNYIADCTFENLENPQELEQTLNMIPGVVENGLFVNMTHTVITVDKESRKVIEIKK
ncbi:ribose-5-phosphate isomerase [Bacillus sp. OV322]|uniref:ribose-5-phosphate isomerase RpiA n=1 Tax=Bacillus sp. OV322 TaxID=1882764 RepID=UPI0008F45799|nr:ribose-5-phosphate isomerase RpiA [Bacillus sp. OV322]SFC72631.1 ribose-5-phosphate isomerase [Bacillus sp. OV322]